MNADELLRHCERITDASEAITRLRRFVLDLAMRGKLTERDPREGSASALVSSIQTELSNSGGVGRRGRSGGFATQADRPFVQPGSWEWVRLGSIAEKLTDGSHNPPPDAGSGAPMLSSQNILDGEIDFVSPSRYLSELDFHSEDARTRIGANDVLLTIVGSIGRSAVVPESAPRFALQRSVAVIRTRLLAPFLSLQLRSPTVQSYFSEHGKGTAQKGIYLGKLALLPIVVPPLAEQHRIVAKVDELMALCDRLEAAREEREAARDRLTAASLARLNTPDPESFREDARFALDSLSALTARAEQVDQLRQTILNLAARGRLVAQDQTEVPAAMLLQQIAAGKVARKQATGDARIKVAPDPDPADLPMPLPPGWAAQSFENLFLFIDYRGNTPPKTTDGIPLITAKNVRMGYLNREPREFISAATFKTWMTRGFPAAGDLFFTTEAPLANVCLNDITEPFALAQRVICLQPYGEISTRFLMTALMSDVMQSLIDAHATGLTAKGIKAAKLKPLPIPIPPLAEQQRIVAKVDELMALCDQLETALSARERHRRDLLESLLHEALEPAAMLEEIA